MKNLPLYILMAVAGVVGFFLYKKSNAGGDPRALVGATEAAKVAAQPAYAAPSPSKLDRILGNAQAILSAGTSLATEFKTGARKPTYRDFFGA